jgi:hypothetical protein
MDEIAKLNIWTARLARKSDERRVVIIDAAGTVGGDAGLPRAARCNTCSDISPV